MHGYKKDRLNLEDAKSGRDCQAEDQSFLFLLLGTC